VASGLLADFRLIIRTSQTRWLSVVPENTERVLRKLGTGVRVANTYERSLRASYSPGRIVSIWPGYFRWFFQLG
jgi:hypothetical protein